MSHTNSMRAIHVLKHFDRIEDVVVKDSKDYQLMMQNSFAQINIRFNTEDAEAMLAAFYDNSKTIDAKHKPAAY